MIERCIRCDEPTGRAGEGDDSLYDEEGNGPYCQDCYDALHERGVTLDEIIAGTRDFWYSERGYRYKNIAKRVRCVDGASLSVQASKSCYCSPREDFGPYYEVEVGFLSAPPPDTWAEYYDGSREEFQENPRGGVYGYIPVELVREYVGAHGGEAEQPCVLTWEGERESVADEQAYEEGDDE